MMARVRSWLDNEQVAEPLFESPAIRKSWQIRGVERWSLLFFLCAEASQKRVPLNIVWSLLEKGLVAL